YATHRKQRLGLSAPVTVEVHDLSQRWWNILIDSSRVAVDTGVVGLGSIHHRTGAVCMPVASVPPLFNLESAISASYCPDMEPVEFQRRYKSPWIQLIGSRPSLLFEPTHSQVIQASNQECSRHLNQLKQSNMVWRGSDGSSNSSNTVP